MAIILNNVAIDKLTDDDHYRNLLKILNWDGYSKWDEYQREKLYYLHMYRNFIIEETEWDNLPIGCDFDKFFQEVL